MRPAAAGRFFFRYNRGVCASTWLRVLRGGLAGLLFYAAGERALAGSDWTVALVFALLGAWLLWQAITGAG